MNNEAARILADAIRQSFLVNPDVNVADAIVSVGYHLKNLGNADAATPMGAIEAHGAVVQEVGGLIADSISEVAEALRELADAVREAGAKPG